MTGRVRRGPSEWAILAIPYLWLVAFFLAPFAIVVKISMSQAVLAMPPYEPAFDFTEGLSANLDKLSALGFSTYASLADDWLYAESYFSSLRIAAIATLLTLLVAYPLSFAMARAPKRWRAALVVFAIAPFWTSFLIRVYAWIAILKDEGLLNHALMSLGIIAEPLHIFATDIAVMIGIVYSYLPFMVLPLYNAIARQPPELSEAAADLGASPTAIFWRITVPLSFHGIVAGCLLVFIPAIGEFVIPDLLGGSDTLMIGHTMWVEFFDNRDWPTASAATVVLLLVLVGPMILYERSQIAGEAGR